MQENLQSIACVTWLMTTWKRIRSGAAARPGVPTCAVRSRRDRTWQWEESNINLLLTCIATTSIEWFSVGNLLGKLPRPRLGLQYWHRMSGLDWPFAPFECRWMSWLQLLQQIFFPFGSDVWVWLDKVSQLGQLFASELDSLLVVLATWDPCAKRRVCGRGRNAWLNAMCSV